MKKTNQQKQTSKKVELDKFHYHEMLDRLHVVMSMIDDHLQQHPVAKIETKIKDLIRKPAQQYKELYETEEKTVDKEIKCIHVTIVLNLLRKKAH